jgi:G3E family GTPase
VIENEFGEVGVDQELVIGAEEEIFEMNNGCICCTVRGDLIRILGNLMKRRDKFDYILVETTGMADPGPVAQTFFVDDEMQAKLRLDGIVTLVDAKHVWQHIDSSKEVKEQIAFADVLVLNKTDLVSAEELMQLESRVRSMNAAAKVYRTQNAAIDIDRVLSVGGFNLERAIEVDPKFMEPEYPFEWRGLYSLPQGKCVYSLKSGPDPSMKIALLPAPDMQEASLEACLMEAVLVFSEESIKLPNGGVIRPAKRLYQLTLSESDGNYGFEIEAPGQYLLYTEHKPEEFQAALSRSGCLVYPVREKDFKPDHEHDDEITSVGITTPGDLDRRKFNTWMSGLLQTQGVDIFRMKGVLSLKGEESRFVFQGVHMLFDGRPDRPWKKDERHNQLIFIGRNLDRARLNEGFRSCLA